MRVNESSCRVACRSMMSFSNDSATPRRERNRSEAITTTMSATSSRLNPCLKMTEQFHAAYVMNVKYLQGPQTESLPMQLCSWTSPIDFN